MRVTVIMALALSAVLIAVIATAFLTRPSNPFCHEGMPCWTRPAPQPSCEEDMPCWNCETMGNRICGSKS